MTTTLDNIARPFEHSRRNTDWRLVCGCRILGPGEAPDRKGLMLVTGELAVIHCPLHASAQAMREMLALLALDVETLLPYMRTHGHQPDPTNLIKARALLAKIGG